MTQKQLVLALKQSHLWLQNFPGKVLSVECRGPRDCSICVFNNENDNCLINEDDVITPKQLTWLQTHHPEHLI